MDFETPEELGGRLKLGREEFCQRLLTSLILHAPYPRWNTRSTPSSHGIDFLSRLYRRCFDQEWAERDPEFVDELELRARSDAERGAAPDYGVLWPGHVWLIELKTEAASHRHDQIPYYFDLGAHCHPDAQLDITYLTPTMRYQYTPPRSSDRFSHITWADVVPMLRATWATPESLRHRAVIDGLCDTLDRLDQPPSVWRASLAAPGPVPAPPQDVASPIDRGVELAAATAADDQQRALAVDIDSLDDLLDLRLEIRTALAAHPPGSPVRRVMVWLWRPESKGSPRTAGGAEHGFELRFSRYPSDQY